jgi:hypothetical protein
MKVSQKELLYHSPSQGLLVPFPAHAAYFCLSLKIFTMLKLTLMQMHKKVEKKHSLCAHI